jgi:hypothetical protein
MMTRFIMMIIYNYYAIPVEPKKKVNLENWAEQVEDDMAECQEGKSQVEARYRGALHITGFDLQLDAPLALPPLLLDDTLWLPGAPESVHSHQPTQVITLNLH